MASVTPDSTADNGTSVPTNLLVVEDDEAIGEFIAEVLRDETPHAILQVTDAAQALEAVGVIKPGLFILDYHLPGINGLELADRLHAITGFETIPTLMISADPPPRRAMQQRHITLLEKPFELDDLVKAIQNLLPP
jgi:DNA-binding response OmpR family regulator